MGGGSLRGRQRPRRREHDRSTRQDTHDEKQYVMTSPYIQYTRRPGCMVQIAVEWMTSGTKIFWEEMGTAEFGLLGERLIVMMEIEMRYLVVDDEMLGKSSMRCCCVKQLIDKKWGSERRGARPMWWRRLT